MRLFWNSVGRKSPRPASALRARLSFEELESRIVPYSTTGNIWPSTQLITLSFAPDGTVVSSGTNGTVTSDMFAKFDAKFGSEAAWENVIIKAAQTWAQYANINFAVVPDNGTTLGQGNYQQGDPGMGDIRFAAEPMASNYLGFAYFPPPVNNYSAAGDIAFNDTQTYNINGYSYDLYTVALHEIGHALGLDHSTQYSAVMYPSYHGTLRGVTSDDIAGVQAIYGARTGDAYGGSGVSNPDNSFASAADISSQIDPVLANAQLANLDISTAGQAEYFKFTAPLTSLTTLTVNVDSAGLSLLRPSVTLYAADQTTVLGTASATGSSSGGNLTINYTAPGLLGLPGSVAGQTFYVKVTGADTTAFGTGRYTLDLGMGTGSLISVVAPNTSLLDGTVFSGGGGSADVIPGETSDYYEIADPQSNQTDGAAQPADGSRFGAPPALSLNVAVAALGQPAAPAGTGAGVVPGTVAQGFTQAILVLAPPSAAPQTAQVHLPALSAPLGFVPTPVAQDGQVLVRQAIQGSAFGAETFVASPATSTARETTDDTVDDEGGPGAIPEVLPEAEQQDDAASARRQAADFLFADPQSLAAFNWGGAGAPGLNGTLAAVALSPSSGEQPTTATEDSDTPES